MRRSVTWLVALLVAGVAAAAIVAAIVNDDSPSTADAVAAPESTTSVSLCDSRQLDLSLRASGFGAHVAGLRLSGTEPCDLGELHVTATVVDRNGRSVRTKVAPPQELSGAMKPGEERIASFDYTMRCGQKGPFSATVIAEGEIGSVSATAPVAFRRDPFTTHPC